MGQECKILLALGREQYLNAQNVDRTESLAIFFPKNLAFLE